jgi:hypothetical protein
MSLRVGVDLDGTLADLGAAYREVGRRLFGSNFSDDTPTAADLPRLKDARALGREQQQIWDVIRRTPDFWTYLPECDDGAVRRLYEAAASGGWEVYFTTQRPATAGRTVQAQSQAWLGAHGFPGACVLALKRSRGRVADLLDLDWLIDDLAQNCVDVIADSRCRPLLMIRRPEPETEATASRLRIEVVRSIDEALNRLTATDRPTARDARGPLQLD